MKALFSATFTKSAGFRQAIHYPPGALYGDEDEFFNSRTHEGTHALQVFGAACIHASPNSAGDIALRPRDKVWVRELMEKDAYAKAILLSAQLLLRKSSGEDPDVTVADTTRFAKDTIDMVQQMLQKIMEVDDNGPVSAKEQYNRAALMEYEPYARMLGEIKEGTGAKSGMQLLKKHGHAVPVYVRLEEQDIEDIGNSFGINLFTDESVRERGFADLSLSPFMEEEIQRMNEALEIKNEKRLPTFSAALAAKGLTRAEFLAMNRRAGPAR